MKSSDRRPTIGLLVSGITEYFTASICRGVEQAAKKADVNIVVLPGKNIDRDLSLYPKLAYEYQYTTLFSYPSPENLDGVIVSADAIGCYSTKENIGQLLAMYDGLPCVLVASKYDSYPSVNYDNDQGIREAMDFLIHHLHCKKFGMIGGPAKNTDARERKRVFCDILLQNGISLEERNYVEGDLTRFDTEAPRRFLDQNPDVEAVFCVNDDTAVPFYAELKKRGLVPGKDIYVFGYDNASFASQMTPSLTSVRADTGTLGTTAFAMMMDLLEGKEVSSVVLPTTLIKRDSFGTKKKAAPYFRSKSKDAFLFSCFDLVFYRCRHSFLPDAIQETRDSFDHLFNLLLSLQDPDQHTPRVFQQIAKLTDHFLHSDLFRYADINNLTTVLEDLCADLCRGSDLLAHYETKEVFRQIYLKIIHTMNSLFGTLQAEKDDENYLFKLFVNDLTQFEKGSDQSYATLLSGLDFAGISNAALYIFPRPLMHLLGEPFVPPKTLLKKTVLRNGMTESIPLPQQETCLRDLFACPQICQDRFSMVLLPLFSNEFLYGLILCDLTENLFSNAEFLLNQLSSTAKMIHLLNVNETIQQKLEESLGTLRRHNIELNTLSRHDPLTGVLNRRGFFDAAEKLLAHPKPGERFITLYADLNNLKIINDRYGHEEGDFSICLTGRLLKETIGRRAVCGRIGGDEFACLIPVSDEQETSVSKTDPALALSARLFEAFASFNRTSDKAYNITVSTGFCCPDSTSSFSLAERLAQADAMLYQAKQKREKNVAKQPV